MFHLLTITVKRKYSHSTLLLMDNAGCYPEHLQGKFSNIKVCFVPANTTSKDLAKFHKVHYRKEGTFMQRLMSVPALVRFV